MENHAPPTGWPPGSNMYTPPVMIPSHRHRDIADRSQNMTRPTIPTHPAPPPSQHRFPAPLAAGYAAHLTHRVNSISRVALGRAKGRAKGHVEGYMKGIDKGIRKKLRRNKKLETRLEKKPFDTTAPCCKCQSLVHQLAGHPNANTPEGYLKGCLPCNTKDHSFSQCTRTKPGQKWCKWWRYYREGREGLAPGESHLDPREIKDARGDAYNLLCMPFTPAYAKANPYPDEINFKPRARYVANLGCFSGRHARIGSAEQEKWEHNDFVNRKALHWDFWQSLETQYNARKPSACTKEQLDNFSTIHHPRNDRDTLLPTVETENIAHSRFRSTVSPTPSAAAPSTRRYSPLGSWDGEMEDAWW
ncbi:uncharacterized protein PAC_17692 [Phialocephala subalpina]|uniref:Uncharacterized protein n=1 Tax=Phialocephala subalpina TaxID=576137 RepID=A0A1L7XRX3_9HELO|nr:uncharacterized protein PAC_17692 [Phialocephala subalpina]